MLRRPPRLTLTDTLFPYRTVFRFRWRSSAATERFGVSTGHPHASGLPARYMAMHASSLGFGGACASPSNGFVGAMLRRSSPPLAEGGAGGSPPQPPASMARSEEHTSELQSLMRISYAVFCLKKKKTTE